MTDELTAELTALWAENRRLREALEKILDPSFAASYRVMDKVRQIAEDALAGRPNSPPSHTESHTVAESADRPEGS